jgi:hypothetical protein
MNNTSVPDYTKINFAVDIEEAKKMIDFGLNLYRERAHQREINKKLYNSYNGIINKKEIDRIVKKHGKLSSTPYIPYRIGRNKIKQLIGEFLQIGVRSTVYTINPEAQKAKYKRYINYKGMAKAKPMIEKARQQGMNVYPGYKIPDDKDVKITADKFKGKNEIVMQTILNYKLLKENLLKIFGENWKQLILTSEMCGKLERDKYYSDTFRPIDSNNAIFIENMYDPFVNESFILGERRTMFKHQILQVFAKDFHDNPKLLEELDNIEHNSSNNSNIDQKSGEYLYEVFSFQFYGSKTHRKKVSKGKNGGVYTKFIDDHEYKKDKDKIEKDIKKGKYSIVEEVNRMTIFEGSLIGSDLYLGIKEKENNIIYTDDNGFEHIKFDYVFGLFDTVDGVRISLQEIVYEMEKVYDSIRRQINLEISKMRGDMAIFDEAFMTSKKPFKEVLHDLSEYGTSTMNSSAEGAVSGDDETVIDRFVKTFKLGDSETIKTLITMALDIEQTLDRVTGMNDDRQGLGNASSTATTNQNNVNASISMTYDMFYFAQTYVNEVLSRLIEKVKINWTWLDNGGDGMILSDDEYGYLKATRELANDSYGAFITDGKFEFDLKRKLEQFFLAEINANKLRTLDVAKFYNEKSYAGSMKVLQDAYDILNKTIQQQEQIKTQSQQQIAAGQQQQNMQIHEDTQAHEIDKIRTKGEEDRKTKALDNDMENSVIVNKTMREQMNDQKKMSNENAIKEEEMSMKRDVENAKLAQKEEQAKEKSISNNQK